MGYWREARGKAASEAEAKSVSNYSSSRRRTSFEDRRVHFERANSGYATTGGAALSNLTRGTTSHRSNSWSEPAAWSSASEAGNAATVPIINKSTVVTSELPDSVTVLDPLSVTSSGENYNATTTSKQPYIFKRSNTTSSKNSFKGRSLSSLMSPSVAGVTGRSNVLSDIGKCIPSRRLGERNL